MIRLTLSCGTGNDDSSIEASSMARSPLILGIRTHELLGAVDQSKAIRYRCFST